MPTPYAIIDGIMWDLDIEEPVLILSNTDAEDKECVEQFLEIALSPDSTDNTEPVANKVAACDCETPHYVNDSGSCRGLHGVGATGIYACEGL